MQSFKLKNATITCDGIVILKTKDENLSNKLRETIENSNNNNNNNNNNNKNKNIEKINEKDFEESKNEIKARIKELQTKVDEKTKIYNHLCKKLK
jgi:predicted solute-binding protein